MRVAIQALPTLAMTLRLMASAPIFNPIALVIRTKLEHLSLHADSYLRARRTRAQSEGRRCRPAPRKAALSHRPQERRVGQECVNTCQSRWYSSLSTKK